MGRRGFYFLLEVEKPKKKIHTSKKNELLNTLKKIQIFIIQKITISQN